MKNSLKRYEDTLHYIASLGSGGLSLVNQLNKLILTDTLKEEVSSQIELVFTFGPKNTNQRHALRALLLYQYVFIGKMWRKYFGSSLEVSSDLPTNWKSQSVEHWKFKTQLEVNKAIAIYMRTDPQTFYLADIAEDTPDFIEPDALKITRENFTMKRGPSCYQAVMIWLFMSGFTSYQWLLKYKGAAGEAALSQAFGPPTQTLYKADDAKLREEINLGVIQRGNFIHLYCQEGQMEQALDG